MKLSLKIPTNLLRAVVNISCNKEIVFLFSDEITAKTFNKNNESNNLREQMKQKEEGLSFFFILKTQNYLVIIIDLVFP